MGSVTKEAMQSLDATMTKWFGEHGADYKEARASSSHFEEPLGHSCCSSIVCAADSLLRAHEPVAPCCILSIPQAVETEPCADLNAALVRTI